MDDFIIRKANLHDISAIIPLWEELMLFHASRDAHYQVRSDAKKNFGEFLDQSLKDTRMSALYVAETQSQIIGYCLCKIRHYPPVFLEERYGEILDLAVKENSRRQGAGMELVNATRVWFKEQKLKRIELSVALTNEISTKFWRKAGFRSYMEMLYQDLPSAARRSS